jgi:hypothetical protein
LSLARLGAAFVRAVSADDSDAAASARTATAAVATLSATSRRRPVEAEGISMDLLEVVGTLASETDRPPGTRHMRAGRV